MCGYKPHLHQLTLNSFCRMNIRRYYIPNSIVFVTQVVDRRAPIFRDQTYIDLLRTILANVKSLHPFRTVGYVFLPDHFHLLIHPTGESNFSAIMHSLKPNFTKEYKKLLGLSRPMRLWQKGFWDHLIRDEVDFQRHLDYIHYNPAHHGMVEKPEEWPHSSYQYWQRRGAYSPGWGWSLPHLLDQVDWQQSEADSTE